MSTSLSNEHDWIIEDDLNDSLPSLDVDDVEEESHEPTEWTIVSALNCVLDQARGSRLSKKFLETCKQPLSFLTQQLCLTEFQVVVLAILIESGEKITLHEISKFLHCSRLSIMLHSEEIEEMVEKRWFSHRRARIGDSDGYVLVDGVVNAICHNKPFVPEKIDGLDTQELIDKVERRIDKNMNNCFSDFEDDEKWMVQLCKANPHLPFCREVMRFQDDPHVQSLLMMVVFDYAQWAESDGEGLTIKAIEETYSDDYETYCMCQELRDGSHILIRSGWIEHKCENGVANNERYVLTRKCKEELLSDYIPRKTKCPTQRSRARDLRRHASIKEKNMFYNPSEQSQIERLAGLLGQESLIQIQRRLAKAGMRKGFACLFYGDPGTGKTETVLQLARQTGRDIMQINIANMRDKYVGESEKNLKEVFARYRYICKHSDNIPILFFNEADAIFGKRTNVGGLNPTVEKMENAMQDILLQEMEDLEGILIATTNLTCNLDDAFDRRFLFKVEFKKPGIDVRTKLWNSMLKNIVNENESRCLATKYDFSGGQIENIARKCAIEYILSGDKPSLDKIDEFCKHELMNKDKERKPIGFLSN